jgi:hypothetical protein
LKFSLDGSVLFYFSAADSLKSSTSLASISSSSSYSTSIFSYRVSDGVCIRDGTGDSNGDGDNDKTDGSSSLPLTLLDKKNKEKEKKINNDLSNSTIVNNNDNTSIIGIYLSIYVFSYLLFLL